MTRLVLAGLAAFALTAGTAFAQSANGISITGLNVGHRAPGGNVQGNVAIQPGGVGLQVTVKYRGRLAGRSSVTSSASGQTSFRVKLSSSLRKRLRRHHKLTVDVEATATGPGVEVSQGTRATVVP